MNILLTLKVPRSFVSILSKPNRTVKVDTRYAHRSDRVADDFMSSHSSPFHLTDYNATSDIALIEEDELNIPSPKLEREMFI